MQRLNKQTRGCCHVEWLTNKGNEDDNSFARYHRFQCDLLWWLIETSSSCQLIHIIYLITHTANWPIDKVN